MGSTPRNQPESMLIVTTENIAGHKTVKVLGVVIGYGYPAPFTSGIEKQREESWNNARYTMTSQARKLDANAIIALRIEWHNAISVAYGTAVVVEAEETTSSLQEPSS